MEKGQILSIVAVIVQVIAFVSGLCTFLFTCYKSLDNEAIGIFYSYNSDTKLYSTGLPNELWIDYVRSLVWYQLIFGFNLLVYALINAILGILGKLEKVFNSVVVKALELISFVIAFWQFGCAFFGNILASHYFETILSIEPNIGWVEVVGHMSYIFSFAVLAIFFAKMLI